ncbi:MAG: hypothetical protein ACRC1O_03960 [Ralstonia mannitolilytica]|nr:hypothetical protein G5A69_11510 [Ralstonia mannitolilytica]
MAKTATADAQQLRYTIESIDTMSQNAFSEIAAIAGLALSRLETPEGFLHPEDIAYALQAIRSKAQDIESCINAEAESVGCNYKDASMLRRFDAHRAAEAMRSKREVLQ